MTSFVYHMPTELVFGTGVLKQLPEYVEKLGNRVMIVTGQHAMKENGIIDRLVEIIKKPIIVIFNEVESDPLSETVERGGRFARENHIDLIVAIGGGSVIDCAKGIAVAATHEGRILDYANDSKTHLSITSTVLPVIAIPTTAGTGSEVNLGAVITDLQSRSKRVLVSSYIFPKVAIVDPQLTWTLPRKDTIYTGIDALCQSIEAYVSLNAQPGTDPLALHAIHLVAENIEKVVENGTDSAARENMSLAATLSGIAISQAGVGAVHAISMVLGGQYGISHGLGIALVQPYVVQYNSEQVLQRYATVARIWGAPSSLKNTEVVDWFYTELLNLNKRLGLNSGLSDLGVAREDIPSISALACAHSDMSGNPRTPSVEDVIRIIEKIY